jgi:hypothetical protein
MIINNFDLFRTGSGPAKANSELPVDSNAVLTLPVAMQRLQHIAGRNFKIIQLACSLKLPNFPQGNAFEIDKTPDAATTCQLLGVLTLERYDHRSIMTQHITNVKRYYMRTMAAIPHPTMSSIEVLGIHPVKLAHTFRKIAVRCFNQKMAVIAHQTVGVALPVESLTHFVEN